MRTIAKVPSPRQMLDGVPPDTRVVIAGVSWEFYDRFTKTVRDGTTCRVAFDGKDIEMLTIEPLHEVYRTQTDVFIAIVAGELDIDYQALGLTTWKRKKVGRGWKPIRRITLTGKSFLPLPPPWRNSRTR